MTTVRRRRRPWLATASAVLFLVVAALPFFAAATVLSAPAPPTPGERTIAITVDDLPWVTLGVESPVPDPARMHEFHRRLVTAIAAADAPVTGFVNAGKLHTDVGLDTGRVQMLRDWLATGADLGNHTWGHVDLHAVGLAAYEADILRGDAPLRALLGEYGRAPQWFRHPYLSAGRSAGDKAALAQFLAGHGYRIAPVTVDNSDWIWASAYRKVLEADADPATLARLRTDYVPYMLEKLDYYERFSVALLGYRLPQVLLLHANELNADTWGELIAGLHGRGYRIVGLAEALRDPAYARADGYFERWGPSWLHRWAMAESRPREFFAGEPTTPEWVLELSGVDGE